MKIVKALKHNHLYIELIKKFSLVTLGFNLFCFHASSSSDSSHLNLSIAGSYLMFNGNDSGNALSTGSKGYAGSLSASTNWSFISLVAGGEFQYSNGSENFYDSTGLKKGLTYRYYAGLLSAGARMNIVPGKFYSVYGKALGLLGEAILQLPASSTYKTLSASSSGVATGYKLSVGLELGPRDRQKTTIPFLEISRQVFRANVQGISPFGFDAWVATFGIVW